MKRAFTLVELMVVIAIMGMMAVVSIGGYAAITRGMSDRAALGAAKSLADAALQRANIDRAKTYIYLFDEVTRIDTEQQAGVVNGVAIAVRAFGRISAVPSSDLFCDEFGDLDNVYVAHDEEDEASQSEQEARASTFRLYNIADKTYALVKDGVFNYSVQDVDLSTETETPREFTMYGFKKVSGEATFKVGQQYGVEFMVTRLPVGYIFGSSASMSSSSDLGSKKINIIEVNPTDSSAPSIKVYRRLPSGEFKEAGETGKLKDGEQ